MKAVHSQLEDMMSNASTATATLEPTTNGITTPIPAATDLFEADVPETGDCEGLKHMDHPQKFCRSKGEKVGTKATRRDGTIQYFCEDCRESYRAYKAGRSQGRPQTVQDELPLSIQAEALRPDLVAMVGKLSEEVKADGQSLLARFVEHCGFGEFEQAITVALELKEYCGLAQRIAFLKNDEQIEAQTLFAEFQLHKSRGDQELAKAAAEEIRKISNARQQADLQPRITPLLDVVSHMEVAARQDLAKVLLTAGMDASQSGLRPEALGSIKSVNFVVARKLIVGLTRYAEELQQQIDVAAQQIDVAAQQTPPNVWHFAKQPRRR